MGFWDLLVMVGMRAAVRALIIGTAQGPGATGITRCR
jgi:hypothetical protein